MNFLKLSLLFSLIVTNQAFASMQREPDLYKKVQLKNYVENRITATRTEKQIIASQLTNLAAQQSLLEAQKENATDLKKSHHITEEIDQIACNTELLQFKNKKHQQLLAMYKQQVKKINDEFVAAQIKAPTIIIAENSIQLLVLDIESALKKLPSKFSSPTSTTYPPLTPKIQ